MGHPAVSVQFLEDQLRLIPARIEAIKNQVKKFEINIQFLEPSTFESIGSEAATWWKFLEDQLRLSPARVEAIKNQVEKFEINIQFLEPSTFEGIAREAATWRKFIESQAGPSS